MVTLLDGKKTARKFLKTIFQGIPRGQNAPRLLVFAVGYTVASQVFVHAKARTCRKWGVSFRLKKIRATAQTQQVCKLILEENQKFDPDGIVIQLPLPAHLDTERILKCMPLGQDIDGLASPRFISPVVLGMNYLFAEYGITVAGKRAVVVGRGRLVGKPVSAMLRKLGARVVVCDQETVNLKAQTKTADILVTGVGKPGLITRDMVKPNAVVVDVGVAIRGGKMAGDVDFAGVAPKVSYITPVPGGMGPMTVAMLLYNLLAAWKKRRGDASFS